MQCHTAIQSALVTPSILGLNMTAGTIAEQQTESDNTENVSRMPKLDSTNTPPCDHNRWTLYIRKKRYYVFECMTCSTLWKTKLAGSQKCLDFFAGHCPNGDSCIYPHIYSKRVSNREESSLEIFRSSGVRIGGFSSSSQPTDLQFLLDRVQELSEEEDLSESTCSVGDSGSQSSSCCNSSIDA